MEINNKEFNKSFRGYNQEEVDAFLDKTIEDYEKLYKNNLDLKEDIEKYKSELEKYKNLEETLHKSLVLAQETADEVKKNAEEKAKLLIREAEAKVESMENEATKKVENIYKQHEQLVEKTKLFKIRFKSFLQAQIDSLEKDHEGDENNLHKGDDR